MRFTLALSIVASGGLTVFPLPAPGSRLPAHREGAHPGPAIAEPVPTLSVGNPRIDPSRTVPYEARWRVLSVVDGRETETSIVTERLELVELEGKKVLRQTQLADSSPPSGAPARTVIDFDPETLAPLRQEAPGPGGTLSVTEYDWSENTMTTTVGTGEPTTIAVAGPAFLASRPGLVLASLPLGAGFEARVPLGVTPQRWWVTVRVVGSELFDAGDGEKRAAWLVVADWEQVRDPNVVFMGDFKGGGGGGGSFLVLKDAPRGAYAIARLKYESATEGPTTLFEMRDGLLSEKGELR